MARIVSEDAVKAVENRFDLVLIASRRVRELRNGWQRKVDSDNGDLVTALREIEQGFVGRDYLLKPTDIDRRRKKTSEK